MVRHAVFVCGNDETMMKWLDKIIMAVIVAVTVVASTALAILNPQMIAVNLWGWKTIEHTITTWLLIMLALGVVIGVSLASILIARLQSRLYVNQRKLLQWQNKLEPKESKK